MERQLATPAQNQASSPVLPPQIDRNDLKALEAISSAAIGPSEAYFVVRGLLQKDQRDEVLEASYEAMRSVVFQFVAGRVVGDLLDRWADALLRVRQLFRSHSEVIAERFTVLSDFLEQANRLAEFHPAEELRRRKHVESILTILANNDRPVERAYIAEATGLSTSNLSRILGNLTAIGWIARHSAGREVVVSITPEGRRVGLGEQATATPGSGPFASLAALEILRSVWGRSGASVAMSSAAGIVACDAKFASLLGFADPTEVVGQSTSIIRGRLGEMTAGGDEVAPDEVILSDGSHHRIVEHSAGDKSLWLGFDVTPYKQRIEAYARREKVLSAELASLRRRKLTKDAARPYQVSVIGSVVDSYDLASYLEAIRNDLLFPITAINNAGHQLRYAVAHSRGNTDLFFEQIDIITRDSDRVRNALRDLLYVGSSSRLAVSTFTPSDVVRDVTDSLIYSSRALDQSLEVFSDLNEEVETDELLFRSTVRNAVSGVMQLAPYGGKIAVETQKVDDNLLLLVKTSWTKALGAELASPAQLSSFNLCRHAVSQIGGLCELESTRKGVVARISLPIMGRTGLW